MFELAIVFSNVQWLMVGQIIIGLLVIGGLIIQVRNYKLGRLLVRDKTIMFAGFLNKEDYERVIQEKGHLFRMIPESEINDKDLTEETGISKTTKTKTKKTKLTD